MALKAKIPIRGLDGWLLCLEHLKVLPYEQTFHHQHCSKPCSSHELAYANPRAVALNHIGLW